MRALLLVVLLSAGCSSIPSWARQPRPAVDLTADEISVVVALLSDAEVSAGWGAPEPALLLDEAGRTGAPPHLSLIGPDGEHCAPEELLTSLPTAGLIRARLPVGINYGPHVALHGWRQFWEAYYSRDEAAFTARYGSYVNVVSVSRVAFSASRQHAIVGLLQFSPRTGCSSGYLTYLERVGGRWHVLATGGLAIS